MDFQLFKTNVINIKNEAEKYTVSDQTHTNNSTFDNFLHMINKLYDFLDDEKNINALIDYEQKPDAKKDNCPLDILCKDLLSKLIVVDPLLDLSIFDHMFSRRNPTAVGSGPRVIPPSSYNSMGLDRLTMALNTLFENNILSAFETLKYLSGHNKTLVILGANGSGKTSFANYLKSVESHVKIIPANKPITVYGHIQHHYDATFETVKNELFGSGANKETLLKLIISLCSQHDDCARIYNDGGNKTNSTYDIVKGIFDEYFEISLDNSAFSQRQIKGRKATGASFDFNKMSDGERAAFFYIATAIIAPPQSFIIVDEPENHLNPAIYNKIWDRLMEVRSDCQFIFISHTMEFINARSDYELVKIKKFIYPDKFEFEFLGSTLEDLSSDFIVEVIGSRKPIIFCEGSKADYDYKVYETLFGHKYTVIPSGNCTSVENSVDACNTHATTYSIQSAIGIIDSDLKSDSEIDRLKIKKVFSLKCNEIEMLLLDEEIFKKVLAQIFKPVTEFVSFKSAFFSKLTQRKQHIIKRLVKTQIDEKLKKSVIDDKTNKSKDELKANLSHIFSEIDVDALWESCNTKITDIISRQDYDAALKYCCLEHAEVIVGVGKPFVTDYATLALGVMKDDESLANVIRGKYFADFDL